MLAVIAIEEEIPDSEYAHFATELTVTPRDCDVPSPPPLPQAEAGENPVSEITSALLESTTPKQAKVRFAIVFTDMAKLKTHVTLNA